MVKRKSLSPAERSIVERTTYPIGMVFDVGGDLVRCIERPYVVCVREACSGCYFSERYKTCPPSQCSSFGRTDGKNVWFVKADNHEDIEDC